MERLALGFAVLAADGTPLGRLVDVQGEWLVIESGRLFKIRRAAPRAMASVDDVQEEIVVHLDARFLHHTPILEDARISEECASVLHNHFAQAKSLDLAA